MSSHLPPEQMNVLHRVLLNKGAELNEQLVRLLNGEGIDLEAVPGAILKPGERPAERLRRFLELVDSKIQASRPSSLTRYGLCDSCGAPLSFTELEQVPWADCC